MGDRGVANGEEQRAVDGGGGATSSAVAPADCDCPVILKGHTAHGDGRIDFNFASNPAAGISAVQMGYAKDCLARWDRDELDGLIEDHARGRLGDRGSAAYLHAAGIYAASNPELDDLHAVFVQICAAIAEYANRSVLSFDERARADEAAEGCLANSWRGDAGNTESGANGDDGDDDGSNGSEVVIVSETDEDENEDETLPLEGSAESETDFDADTETETDAETDTETDADTDTDNTPAETAAAADAGRGRKRAAAGGAPGRKRRAVGPEPGDDVVPETDADDPDTEAGAPDATEGPGDPADGDETLPLPPEGDSGGGPISERVAAWFAGDYPMLWAKFPRIMKVLRAGHLYDLSPYASSPAAWAHRRYKAIGPVVRRLIDGLQGPIDATADEVVNYLKRMQWNKTSNTWDARRTDRVAKVRAERPHVHAVAAVIVFALAPEWCSRVYLLRAEELEKDVQDPRHNDEFLGTSERIELYEERAGYYDNLGDVADALAQSVDTGRWEAVRAAFDEVGDDLGGDSGDEAA